jgi:hypothetical protein
MSKGEGFLLLMSSPSQNSCWYKGGAKPHSRSKDKTSLWRKNIWRRDHSLCSFGFLVGQWNHYFFSFLFHCIVLTGSKYNFMMRFYFNDSSDLSWVYLDYYCFYKVSIINQHKYGCMMVPTVYGAESWQWNLH